MKATPVPYKNLQRFFIRLKAGQSLTLGAALEKHLHVDPEAARQLILQGSVWDSEGKVRLKNENMNISSQLLRVDRPKFSIQEYRLLPGDIQFEDEQLLVVYKKGGVPVQPTPYSDIDNLLHGVQGYYAGQGIRYQAAPINRLDLPAQGLVFFAKNKKSEIAMHRQFQHHQVRKRYLAATRVFPDVRPSYIIRSNLEWQGRSKPALTYIRFCRERVGRYFFLVFPQSGRTHQIRRHFQEHVAPLEGDVRYGHAAEGSGLWLLCFQYAFRHPASGRKVTVSFLPEDWRRALDLTL
ncbi:MAG: pseudouridine synthase [Candidatus Aminicenantes bacterium]|nr:pseudouridine synthase [Candidatus Aminicenantes bacterium]